MASPALSNNYQTEIVAYTPEYTAYKKYFEDTPLNNNDCSLLWAKNKNTFLYNNLNSNLDNYFNISSEIDLTNQESFEATPLPLYYSNNFSLLNSAFNEEYNKYSHYISVSKEIAKEKFSETASLLSELPFENASVELTKSNSLKYSLLFANDKLLLVTKPLSPIEELYDNEIVFSFFVNRELLLSNAATTSNFVEGFKEFLSM